MKKFINEHWPIIVAIIGTFALAFFLFQQKAPDTSMEMYQIKRSQTVIDSIKTIKDSLQRELNSTVTVIDNTQIERDSIYGLYLLANKKLNDAIQLQKSQIRTDTFGSASLQKYYSQLPR